MECYLDWMMYIVTINLYNNYLHLFDLRKDCKWRRGLALDGKLNQSTF